MSLERASQTQWGLSPLKCALSYPATLWCRFVEPRRHSQAEDACRAHKGTSCVHIVTLGAVTTTLIVYPVEMQQVPLL